MTVVRLSSSEQNKTQGTMHLWGTRKKLATTCRVICEVLVINANDQTHEQGPLSKAKASRCRLCSAVRQFPTTKRVNARPAIRAFCRLCQRTECDLVGQWNGDTLCHTSKEMLSEKSNAIPHSKGWGSSQCGGQRVRSQQRRTPCRNNSS